MVSSLVLLLLTGGLLQIIAIRKTMTSYAQEVSNNTEMIKGDRQVEWHIFLNQLEYHLQGTYEPEAQGSTLTVKEKMNTTQGYRIVRFKRDTNNVNFSKQLNSGNERMLTSIRSLQLNVENEWLILEVTFLNGEKYTGKINVDSWRVNKEEEG